MLQWEIAIALGRTRRELLRSLSSRELYELYEVWARKPFGDYRADFRTGIIASVIATVNGSGKKKFKPSDFMYFLDAPEAAKSPEDLQRKLQLANAMLGGSER